MSAFQVTVASVISKKEELDQLNAQFQQQVSNLSEKEQALNSMWEGEARTAFHSAFSNDKNQFDNFYRAIQQFTTALEDIANKYNSAEQQNQSIASTRSY